MFAVLKDHPLPNLDQKPFSPEMLQSLLEEMGDGAIAIDEKGKITWINKNYHILLGIPADVDPRDGTLKG